MWRVSERAWKRNGWLFGVVSPLLCIALDPGLFKAGKSDQAWFPSIASFFYAATLTSMIALGIALVRDHISPFCRGILLFGAVLASAMSLILVPFAVILLMSGVMAILGGNLEPFVALVPFGFSPVATAVVYWRYFLRAKKPQTVSASVGSLLGTAFAFLFPVGINLGAGAATSPCMERVVGAPREASASDVRCLQRLAFTTDFAPFVRAYGNTDSTRQAELREVYLAITGRDLERDAVLSD